MGSPCTGHPGAEDVDLELLTGLRQRHFLERTVRTVTGGVDQGVDTTFLGEDLLDAGLHLSVVADVRRQGLDTHSLECSIRSSRVAELPQRSCHRGMRHQRVTRRDRLVPRGRRFASLTSVVARYTLDPGIRASQTRPSCRRGRS